MTPPSKKVVLCLAVLGTAVLASVALIYREHEPVYRDKPLTYWLEKLDDPYEDAIQEGRAAFRAIGPPAVPYLVRQARRERPCRTKAYCVVWERLPGFIQHHAPRARPSELSLVSPIGIAFHEIGPAALPALCQACAKIDSETQFVIDHAIKQNARKADGAVLPELVKLLGHPNPQVRAEAAVALGQLPGDFGTKAEAIVAVLNRLITDQDGVVREEVVFARWRFNHDTNTISLLMDELAKAPDWNTGFRILGHFQQMGDIAKPARPAISNIVNRSPPLRWLIPTVANLDEVHFE